MYYYSLCVYPTGLAVHTNNSMFNEQLAFRDDAEKDWEPGEAIPGDDVVGGGG